MTFAKIIFVTKLLSLVHNWLGKVCDQAHGKAGAGWSADHPEFLPCFDFFYEVIFPVNKQGSIESPQLATSIIPVRYGAVNKWRHKTPSWKRLVLTTLLKIRSRACGVFAIHKKWCVIFSRCWINEQCTYHTMTYTKHWTTSNIPVFQLGYISHSATLIRHFNYYKEKAVYGVCLKTAPW